MAGTVPWGYCNLNSQDESIGFFAVLAEDDKLPEQIDPQLVRYGYGHQSNTETADQWSIESTIVFQIDIFISTARDKRRVLAVRYRTLITEWDRPHEELTSKNFRVNCSLLFPIFF